jgi:hypothetical protein
LIGGVGSSATDSRLSEVDHNEPVPLPGILTYDMTTRRWSNHSTVPMSPPDGVVVNSAASCVRGFSVDPLILSLGGAHPLPNNVADDPPLIGMDNITFWDTESQRWHWQTATGDVPPGREHPCVVGAQSTDGTFDIFMYGGKNSYGARDDIYILSLPGFRWFSAKVESPARMHHACANVGKRQMLSTGGVTHEWDWKKEDPWTHALNIFDMTKLEWKDSFDAFADDYESPQMVKNWYNNVYGRPCPCPFRNLMSLTRVCFTGEWTRSSGVTAWSRPCSSTMTVRNTRLMAEGEWRSNWEVLLT